ncbi:VRR-NUC domain-containing protein [Escherichia coli]|nr:VRR-NUC domain-containing protein [Escherichia coli]EFZ8623731.1 VRR-NUC domain-containing protein [Shigella dysenteriae]MBB9117321.1 VRR-NUC domain-containing protein [Escherichia coli]MBB9750850.1 VRR-NUC domain-containing protein [Escherichia coli]MBM6568921.1 VRR-NUC domain-containing protein [Escherichia coli]
MAYERENLIEKHLVAEVKKAGGVAFKFVSPGKPPRPDQLREHGRLRALGFTVVVLDSKNLEAIILSRNKG